MYAGFSYEGQYGWDPAVNGTHEGITVKNYTIIVNNRTNIKEQIFNDNLREGTTIVFEAGVYEIAEQIVIDKAVNLVGAGAENTVFETSVGATHVFDIANVDFR